MSKKPKNPTKEFGVFFDLDGTLIDSVETFYSAYKYALENGAGIKITKAELMEKLGPNEIGVIKRIAGENWEKCLELFYQFETQSIENISIFEGIMDVLAYLKSRKIKTAVITGRGEHHALMFLRKFNLQSHFDDIKWGDEERWNKVDSINNSAKKLNIPQSNLLYIGDTESDMQAAINAGATPILACWSISHAALPKKHHGVLTFHSPSDLLSWMRSGALGEVINGTEQ